MQQFILELNLCALLISEYIYFGIQSTCYRDIGKLKMTASGFVQQSLRFL